MKKQLLSAALIPALALIFGLPASAQSQALVSDVENEGADCAVTISGTGAITANSNLPDPFTKMNGQRMTSKEEWVCRRQEIRKLLEKTVYGEMRVTPFSATTGTVSKTSISVNVSDNGKTASFTAGVDAPSGNGPFPAMIIYGGFGGPSASTLKNQGVAVITFDPAKGGEEGTSRSAKKGAYYTLYGGGSNLGILAAQAWAVSRIIDVIQKSDGSVLKWDAIGVTGCSRYGKGSFVAGVFDQRIALTMPIESGTGGVPIMRSVSNEAKQSLTSAYDEQPWLGDVFSAFRNSPNTMPGDMHWAVAMVAPRGLLILDNPHIANLGPRSAHLSAVAGGEVYKALGYGGNITYFSNSADGSHCTFQPEFSAPLTANINKFLKKQGTVTGGEPTITPRSGVTGNTAMINWTTPTLSGTLAPGGGAPVTGCALTLTASPASGGKITVSPAPNANGRYDSTATVTLTAAASSGWAFDGWSGDASGAANPATVKMNADKSVTAKFKLVADGTENLIKNGTFANTQSWTLNKWSNSAATFAVSNGSANITAITMPSGTGAADHSLQLVQNGISLTQGMKYRLTFDAQAAAAREISVYIQMDADPYTEYFKKTVSLSATKESFKYEFEMTAASDDNGRIAFNFGAATPNVTISNVKLIYIADFSTPTGISAKIPVSSLGAKLAFSVKAVSGSAISVNFKAAKTGEAELRLYGLKGGLITAAKFQTAAGNNYSRTINTGALPKGLYIVGLYSDGRLVEQARVAADR